MTPPFLPLDEHNRVLLQAVHPANWVNPSPCARYDLVVIGAGTAGLVAAAGAAGLGARVALIERHLMGGDCLNAGCVPSKSLLRCANAAHESRRAGTFGVRFPGEPTVDFAAVMQRLRRLRAGMASHDSAARFAGLGVDVFFGEARFHDDRHIDVDQHRLCFRRAVIATGARPGLPDIPGLSEAQPLTNETVFNITECPRRLIVLGGGPIGCELAQAFQRLGSRVTLIHSKDRLLNRDDPDAAEVVRQSLVRDGIAVLSPARVTRVESAADSHRVHVETPLKNAVLETDAILLATGRIPNVNGLNLDRVGVAADPRDGVRVDNYLCTTNPRIFACGDVCLRWKFTHAADIAARMVIRNALFAVGPFGRQRLSSVHMAWCTYTDPELAHTGVTQSEAEERSLPIDIYTQPFDRVDRAITDSETEGFVRVLAARGTGRILGATIVGHGAGDLISELSVAIAGGIGLDRLGSVTHPYPTRAEAIRKLGDQFSRTRLTDRTSRILRWRLRLGR